MNKEVFNDPKIYAGRKSSETLQPLMLLVPTSLKDELNSISEETGMTMNAIVRKLMQYGIQEFIDSYSRTHL